MLHRALKIMLDNDTKKEYDIWLLFLYTALL